MDIICSLLSTAGNTALSGSVRCYHGNMSSGKKELVLHPPAVYYNSCENTNDIENIYAKSMTVDVSAFLCGNSCIKVVASKVSGFGALLHAGIESMKYYFISVWIKKGNTSDVRVRIRNHSLETIKESLPTYYDGWERHGVLLKPPETSGMTKIGIYIRGTAETRGQYMYFKAPMVNEITAAQYDQGLEAVMEKYPSVITGHDFKAGQTVIVKGAGSYRGDWLKTKVNGVNGGVLVLEDEAIADVISARVNHNDSEAVYSAISKLDSANVVRFDVENLYCDGIELSGNKRYDGSGCRLRTPLYCSNNENGRMYSIFSAQNRENIILGNFRHNGSKLYGVEGNKTCGTAFFIGKNLYNSMIENNTCEENSCVVFRMLDTQRNITLKNNTIKQTDAAIRFLPESGSTANFRGIYIEGNYIESTGCNSEAIAITPAMYNWRNHDTGELLASSENIVIRGNMIKKKGRILLVYGGISKNVLIEENDFVEGFYCISGYDALLELKDEKNAAAPFLNASENIVIRNNTFRDTSWQKLCLAGKNIIVENNTFKGRMNGYGAIFAQDGEGVNGLAVKNNSFDLGGNCLIYSDIHQPLKNVSFINNTITGEPGTYVVDLRAGGPAIVQGNSGAKLCRCRVPKGSAVGRGQFAKVEYV